MTIESECSGSERTRLKETGAAQREREVCVWNWKFASGSRNLGVWSR
jgi:hypothetical protein